MLIINNILIVSGYFIIGGGVSYYVISIMLVKFEIISVSGNN